MASPVVTIVSPTPSTTIGERDPLVFTVTDADGDLKRVVLIVRFPGARVHEVAYDGETWAPAYSASTRTVVANGFQYAVRRETAWPASPQLQVIAYDNAGNETV